MGGVERAQQASGGLEEKQSGKGEGVKISGCKRMGERVEGREGRRGVLQQWYVHCMHQAPPKALILIPVKFHSVHTVAFTVANQSILISFIYSIFALKETYL